MYEYFDEMYEEALEHHGILGMKWGVRRFQNYDGTLKAAGKSRYKTDKPTRAERKAAKAEAKAAKEQANIDAAKKRAIETANVDEIIKLSSKMTTDELRDAMARVTAISTMNNNRLPKEKTAFDKAVEGLGIVKKGADALKGAHESIRNLRKELGLDSQSVIEKAQSGSGETKSKSGNKSDDGGKKTKDIFDRVKDFSDKVKEDKAKRDNQRAANDSFIEKLQGISGSKQTPDSSFRLKDGDYSLFRNNDRNSGSGWAEKLASAGSITSVKLPDISVSQAIKSTSLVTKSTVKSIVSSSSKTDSTSISDINKMFASTDKLTEDLLKRNQL